MRYAPDHKEQTRSQIVATAADLFRQDGIVATGVVGLMKSVGLTQGGFYAHFESKQALVREAVVAAITQTHDGLRRVAEAAGGGVAGLEALVDAYLSTRHAEHVERGCALAAVGAELAREPEETRRAFTAASGRIVGLIAEHLPAGHPDATRVARSVFALMAGCVQLARLATDPVEAAAILDDGRAAALALAAAPRPARA